MSKNSVPWSKRWSLVWSGWPGLKETRGPVAFTVLLLLSAYFLLELYLFTVVDSSPPGVVLPISTNSSKSPCHASPYCVINVKSLFLSPMDFYINKPAAILLNRALSLDLFLSANFVSFSHILFSLASIRLIAHDSLCVRRLGVLLFELRNLFDSLDGVIARADAEKKRKNPDYRGQSQMPLEYIAPWTVINSENTIETDQSASNSNDTWFTFGYFIDGICDGIGCIFLMTACLIYLQRHPHRKGQVAYSPLSLVTVNGIRSSSSDGIVSTSAKCDNSHHHHSISKTFVKKVKDDNEDSEPSPPRFGISWIFSKMADNTWNFVILIRSGLSCGTGLPAFLYLFQLLFSSLCWNRDIVIYSKILEGRPNDTGENKLFKSNVIHSTIMWLVIYSWRFVNPLNMTEVLLLAIFFDRMADLLQLFQYSGFVIICCVAALSEIHHSDLVRNRG